MSMQDSDLEAAGMNRRNFLGLVAAAGVTVAGAGLVGCSSDAGNTDTSATPAVEEAWYGTAPEIADADIAETLETEVLICGAGHSGIAAACAAAANGLKVLVIEKNAGIGLGKEYIGAIGTAAQKAAGVKLDKVEVVNEMARYASNNCDQRLMRLWADNSGTAIDFFAAELAEYGITHVAEYDVGDGYHGIFKSFPIHTKFIVPEAANFLPFLQEKAVSHGAEFVFETPLVRVIRDNGNGRVNAAIAQKLDGTYVKINASKGVVLATGGYANNSELMQKLNPAATKTVVLETTQIGNTGDGIKAGIWAGGFKDEVASAMVFDRGIAAPGTVGGYPYGGAGFFPPGSQPWLKVNFAGERYYNESCPYDFGIHAAYVAGAEAVCCEIWDANYWANVVSSHTIGCSRLAPSPSVPATNEGPGPEVIGGMIAQYAEAGLVQTADTLEGLAEALGIPADTFVATVQRYNELAKAGHDDDYGKPAKDMFALETPPFQGVVLGGSLLTTMDGLRINTNLQVVDTTYQPIEGLYAIGDTSGGYFSNNYPELFVGAASGRSLTYAYHVAQILASA